MSFISRFKDATIGFSGYPRLGRDKAGGFGYIALLLLIVMAISAWLTTVRLSQDVAMAIPKLEAGPDFAFQSRHLRFDGPMPHRITVGATPVIIDTTGKTTATDLSKEGPGSILLTDASMYQVEPNGHVRETGLNNVPFSFSRSNVVAWMPLLPRFVPFIYILLYVGQLGVKALDAIILGGIAVLYGRITGRRVTFDLGFKLGLYAMTLPIIIQWIPQQFTTLSPGGFVVWWGLALLYLIMGLRAHQATEAA